MLLQAADTTRDLLRTWEGIDDTTMFLLFMGLLVIFAVVNITDPNYLRDLAKGIIDTNYLLMLHREGKLTLRINDLLLDLLYVCSFGLLLFKYFNGLTLFELGKWIIIVGIYYLGKVIIVKIFSYLFFGSQQLNFHLLQVLAYNKTLALFILPLLFIVFFIGAQAQEIVLNILLYVTIFFLCYRFIRILYNIYLRYSYGIVYGIIYLCAIELTPFLVFYKHFFKV